MSKYNIIAFGSAIVDIFLTSPEFKLAGTDPERFICQAYGGKIEVEKRVICSGGGGTNTAVSFSRLGLSSAAAVRMGNDLFGKIIVNELIQEGVVEEFLVKKDEQTDSSVILVGPDGGRTVLVHRGKTKLEVEDIDFSKLDTDWFYLASLEGNTDLVKKLVSFAKEKNINIAWNPGKRELEDKKFISRFASAVKVFNLNREEAESLTEKKMDRPKFWPRIKALGAEIAIVTDGRKGAYLLVDTEPHFVATPTLSPLDETGAGDAFGSAFVYGLIKEMGPKKAFDLAMKNGASVVQHIGAKKGLLRAKDIS